MARLRRLSDILDRLKDKKSRRADWRCPDNLHALTKEAEDITQQLKSGPLKLGWKVLRNGKRSIIMEKQSIPKATPDGAKYVQYTSLSNQSTYLTDRLYQDRSNGGTSLVNSDRKWGTGPEAITIRYKGRRKIKRRERRDAERIKRLHHPCCIGRFVRVGASYRNGREGSQRQGRNRPVELLMFDSPAAENPPKKAIGHLKYDGKLVYCDGFRTVI